jgi:hypothetical protein
MTYKCWGLAIAVFLLVPAAVFSQQIPCGRTYNSLFADGVFTIIPPVGFNNIQRDDKGATFKNSEKKISFSIHHTAYPELKDKSNDELLSRFKSNEFKQGFYHGFNILSPRKVLNDEMVTLNKLNVFQFTAVDPANKTNPIRGIIFYSNGIEYKITIGANTVSDLDANSDLFKEVLALLNIPQ